MFFYNSALRLLSIAIEWMHHQTPSQGHILAAPTHKPSPPDPLQMGFRTMLFKFQQKGFMTCAKIKARKQYQPG